MNRIVALALGVLVIAASVTPAGEPAMRLEQEWDRYFDEVEGVFVCRDPGTGLLRTNDPERARRGFLPASTFKIPHALIALETGAIRDEGESVAWDGVERGGAWDRDHDLDSAIRVSAVWYFEEMARRIGEERMRHYLEAMGYGNAEIGASFERFWLGGDLRISAEQQIDFLVRLVEGDLPFSERTFEIVRRITIRERTNGSVLHAKTGWTRGDPDLGWYVGWVDYEDATVFFAMNIDLVDAADGPKRMEITADLLEACRAGVADR